MGESIGDNFDFKQIFFSRLKIGDVLKFPSTEISTEIPHYFIIIAIDEDDIYFLCCSSQEDTANKLIKLRNYNDHTVVWIKPDKNNNGLTKGTFVDCNHNYTHSRSQLDELFNNNSIEFIGIIKESDFEQIKTGIKESHLNDFPLELMIYNSNPKNK